MTQSRVVCLTLFLFALLSPTTSAEERVAKVVRTQVKPQEGSWDITLANSTVIRRNPDDYRDFDATELAAATFVVFTKEEILAQQTAQDAKRDQIVNQLRNAIDILSKNVADLAAKNDALTHRIDMLEKEKKANAEK